MNGTSTHECANGARYLRVHYSADPAKDEVWAKIERDQVPIREWEREMEMREDVFDGEPVYADYVDKLHAGPGIPIFPRATYYGGWDCGTTLQPAFVLVQLSQYNQIQVLLEVISNGGESMEVFAPRVLQALIKWHGALWGDVMHHGDATVTTKNGATGSSARQIANRKGVDIHPVPNNWQRRHAAVTWALRRQLGDGYQGFVLDSTSCPVLRRGFQGAYCFQKSAAGANTGPGAILQMPVKDDYSHVHDALQYAVIEIQKEIENRRPRVIREEDPPPRTW